MIRPRLAVCAETVLRDTDTNLMSVVNVIENIRSAAFPVTLPKLSALFVIERDPNDADALQSEIVVALDDSELGRAPLEGRFGGEHTTRLILVAQGIVIPTPGRLTVTLFVHGEAISAWRIPVSEDSPVSM